MPPMNHFSRGSKRARQKTRAPRAQRLGKASATVTTMVVLAMATHTQNAPAQPMMITTEAGIAAGSTSGQDPSYARSSSAPAVPTAAPPQSQTPIMSTPDTTWGIPTPVFAAVLSALIGAAAGTATTTLLFRRGRRHTLTDRAEDQQRQDSLQQRIDARDHWKDEYEDIKTATSGVLALCVVLAERPLCQNDAETQQITTLIRQLRVTIGEVRSKCSAELTASLAQLCTCLTDLKETLLPPRDLLTDPTTNGQYNILDLAARTANQTRAALQLESHAHTARATAHTEWGTPITT